MATVPSDAAHPGGGVNDSPPHTFWLTVPIIYSIRLWPPILTDGVLKWHQRALESREWLKIGRWSEYRPKSHWRRMSLHYVLPPPHHSRKRYMPLVLRSPYSIYRNCYLAGLECFICAQLQDTSVPWLCELLTFKKLLDKSLTETSSRISKISCAILI